MSVEVLSLVIFIAGTLVLLYGIFFSPTEYEEQVIASALDFQQIEKLIGRLQKHVTDADKMIVELDKFSEHVTTEMESKHKELLFLYQIIDEKIEAVKKEQDRLNREREELKNKEALNISKSPDFARLPRPEVISQNRNVSVNNEIRKFQNSTYNATFDEVVSLYEAGKDIDEIARMLGKGKNEIRLMLDLMGKEG